jgi:hypothetical protein
VLKVYDKLLLLAMILVMVFIVRRIFKSVHNRLSIIERLRGRQIGLSKLRRESLLSFLEVIVTIFLNG